MMPILVIIQARETKHLVHNLWPNNSKLHISPQNSKHYQVPLGNDDSFVNHPGVADIKIQTKFLKFLLDMQHFCNFSHVSLGIRPRSRQCAERTRQSEGRWSHPPKGVRLIFASLNVVFPFTLPAVENLSQMS